MLRSKCIVIAFICVAAIGHAASAFVQASSGRVTKIIVPFPAGGGLDLLARNIALALSKRIGSPVIVENKAGGSGSVGADFVAKSPPDGQTLLLSESGPIVIVPNLRATSYNPLTDFALLSLIGRQTPVLAVSNRLPVNTVEEFFAYAKVHPDLPFATSGTGTYFHVAMMQLQEAAGVKFLHVPYKGAAQVVTDLIGGQVDATIVTLPSVEQFDKAKKLKILATATEKRVSWRSDLPTISEVVPNYSVKVWFGMFAAPTTPPAILDKLTADIVAIRSDPEFVKGTLDVQFITPGTETRQAFSDIVKADFDRWGQSIRKLKITAD